MKLITCISRYLLARLGRPHAARAEPAAPANPPIAPRPHLRAAWQLQPGQRTLRLQWQLDAP